MLYTVQLSQVKTLPPQTIVIDITVQSSRPPWNIFAPTWELVKDYKGGKISENQYTEEYMELMRSRYKNNKDIFQQVIQLAMVKNIALACYCPPESFCHRHLLKNIFMSIEPRLQYQREEIPQQAEQMALF
jgi:uncharacterized protein YeaO (DUF488 family)